MGIPNIEFGCFYSNSLKTKSTLVFRNEIYSFWVFQTSNPADSILFKLKENTPSYLEVKINLFWYSKE